MSLARAKQCARPLVSYWMHHLVAEFAGPSLAGLPVQLFTALVALLADALSFLASATALFSIRVQEIPRKYNKSTIKNKQVGHWLFAPGADKQRGKGGRENDIPVRPSCGRVIDKA